MEIVDVLFQHTSKVFVGIPEKSKTTDLRTVKQKFFDALPKQFNRQTYLYVALQNNISSKKTADKYVTEFFENELLSRPKKDDYHKNSWLFLSV